MPFYFKKGDLVATECDAIVNASNVNLKMVEGVGRAIFHKAGDIELTNACKKIGHADVGDAVITPSFNLTNAKAIIHAVGPIYINGKHDEEKNLRKVYRKVFSLALEHNYKTLAFPLLSGEFNYPLRECYEIAEEEITKFLFDHRDFKVYMVLFKNFPENISEDEQNKLSKFILKNFKGNAGVSNVIIENKKKFIETVRTIQAKKEMKDNDLAYYSNYTPDDLNKILDNDSDVFPSKNTCCALAIALHATKDEFISLLSSAGYQSINDDMTGLVTAYFIENKEYNIFVVNRALFNYSTKPLGL